MKDPFENFVDALAVNAVHRFLNVTVGKHLCEGGKNGIVEAVWCIGVIFVTVIGACLGLPPWFVAMESSHGGPAAGRH